MKMFGKIALFLLSKLDLIVVFVIEKLYQLLIMIADTNVFGDLIYGYLGRIYTFLGIFMVFKLSLSMITYIINPDELTDKSKGAGKLVSNVVISLILLVATPTIFDQAFKLQADVLNTNAVYQIVTGKKIPIQSSGGNNNTVMSQNASVVGKQIAYGVYSAFIYNKSFDEDIMNASATDIAPFSDYKTAGNTSEGKKCDSDTMDPYCLVSTDTILMQRGDEYVNQYHWLISTVCGGVVAYMLLLFCIEVAKRAIKLGFLQIVAPIPILSLIDPKTGNKKLMDWAKECGKTFGDLFIRLAGLFFAVEIIRTVLNPPDGAMTSYANNTPVNNVFVRLFIIIGALMFAKQLPQLIESLFGIKLSGDGFSLKKTLGGIPGLGVAKAVGAGALGFAGGMAANSLANMRNHTWDKSKGFWSNIGSNAKTLGTGVLSAAGGGFSGLGRGSFSKEKNMFKAAGAGVAGAVGARNLRASGHTFGDKIKDKYTSFIGGTDDVSKAVAAQKYGDSLYAKYKDNKYAFYKSQDFAKAVRNADIAKDNRDLTQSNYEVAKMKYERGEGGSAEEVNRLRIDAAKASSAYDKAKAELNLQKSAHVDDAKAYDAFSAAEDRAKVAEVAQSNGPAPAPQSGPQSSPSNSNDNPPKHGPNGRGDPVPGRPNPNTSRKKQERRNQ